MASQRLTFQTSFAQQRLWFLEQLEPSTHVYNVPGAFRLKGPLDLPALEEALREIGRRHETLRTSFGDAGGEPHQLIHESLEVVLPSADLSSLPASEREAEAERLAYEECRAPFDLSRAPLWRVKLLRLGGEDHVLLLTMHHIVSDGWSLGVFVRELVTIYEARLKGEPSPLAPLPLQYADYAAWQREYLQGERTDAPLSYWRRQLGGALPLLELPADRPRPPSQTFRGATAVATLPKGLSDALAALGRREGATLFMTLLAAFQTLLSRYTGQEDIIVGSPIAGRDQLEIEGLIGFFVNTLALRCDFSGDPTFQELLARVRETALAAYEHQDVPFEKLVEHLQPERSLSHTPIFQVMFQLGHASAEPPTASGLKVEEFEFDSRAAKFDLSLEMTQQPHGLKARLVYNADLFDAATAERLLGHYRTLLKSVALDPRQRLSALPLLTEGERRQLLVEWNQTTTDYPRDATIQQLFEEQAARTPDAAAVEHEGGALTYAQLNARANQLAHHLRASGAGDESRVGVCVERSPEMLTALVGTLKAGAAYVPLDPAYPRERLSYMIEDAGLSVVLTQEKFAGRLASAHGAKVIAVDSERDSIARESAENPRASATAESLAYIIYTSGSAGAPKGVLVPHRGVVRLVKANNYARLDAGEVFLQFAPLSFDASTFEIWGALLNGARLILMPPEMPSLEEIGDALRRHRVTTLWLTAGLFHQMAESQLESLKGVRQLLVGGDVVSAAHVRRVLADFDGCLINGYGPTENTTFTCYHPMRAGDEIGHSVPIGRPVANTQVYVLDHHLQPVPVGVAGELHIGGDGLAQGYLNAPDLTLEKFIPHPFSDDPAALLYKSGDRARYRPDGSLEFLGRLDRQLKVRGFRVEPGEVEAALVEHPRVRACVVASEENGAGDQRLVAYVVADAQDSSLVEELRRFARERLPKYLVPSAFVLLDELPLTAHGKVERGALPPAARSTERRGTPPRTPVEERLAEIWSELLGVARPCVEDDFFESGGHSLLATRLVSRVSDEFKVKLPLRRLFENPNIASLSELIAAGGDPRAQPAATRASNLVPVQTRGTRRPFFIVPGGEGGERELIAYAGLLRHLGPDQPCYGFAPRVPDGACASAEALARDLVGEMRALQPAGPYLLGGECVGGIVAFEAARQLRAAGEEVGLLALLDTVCPSRHALASHRLSVFRHSVLGRARWYFKDLSELDAARWPAYALDKSRKAWGRTLSALHFNDAALSHDPHAGGDSYAEALLRYRPRPYEGSLTLLLSEDVHRRGLARGWVELATGGATVRVLPGDHTTYIRDHARAVAEQLRDCLDKAQS